ncbi:hypothetical protein [Pedobacter sp. MC2016-24]|uniref:hypothetical protein n=1 Tax=Pedobacter sp. MC2016-24 TaxID=2780090 RepID=UPI00187ECC0B|nr:hypothetical protein [Pedobacter sp. MC2016-24]MBE9599930.1 hypothetical protein [Pedobacter sp. MC2016-24]
MRIYCDSNVFRKAKRTSKQFNQAVYNTLEALNEHFVFLFSEAHLADLTKSQEDYRKEDLILMERYVKNNYFCRDHIKKEIQILLATPTEAYDSKDFQASDEFLENPYDSVSKIFDFEGGEEYGNLFKSIFDLPIFPANDINVETVQPEHRELLEQFKGVRTINDALKKLQGLGQMLDSDSVFNY